MVILQAAPVNGLGIKLTYKCTSTICYSTDGLGINYGTDGIFRSLQTAINKHSLAVGFSPLNVDGKLGASTASALRKIFERAKKDAPGNPNLPTLSIGAVSKESAAQYAETLIPALNTYTFIVTTATSSGGGGGAPYSPPAPYSLPIPDGSFPGAGDTTDVTKPSSDAVAHWPYYAAGGILALATLFGAMTLMRKRSKMSKDSGSKVSTTFSTKPKAKSRQEGAAYGKRQRGLVPA